MAKAGGKGSRTEKALLVPEATSIAVAGGSGCLSAVCLRVS
jgi:hypothetical protein